MRRKVAGIILAAVLITLIGGGAALASCAAPTVSFGKRLNEGVAVFVGFVNKTSNDGRTATATIQEVWTAGALAAEDGTLPRVVEIFGSEVTEPNASSSVDRHYKQGIAYLFVPESGNRESDEVVQFHESACSPTTEFTESVAQHRPPGVEPVAPQVDDRSPEPGRPLPDWLPTAIVVIIASLSAGIVLARRAMTSRSAA